MIDDNYFSDQKQMLDADDISNYLGISRSAVYALFHDPGFPCVKIGKRLLCPKRAFFVWLDSKLDNR